MDPVRQFNAEPLKEPRGLLRCLQWFFAMLAFATCCDFATKISFDVKCELNPNDTVISHVSVPISYPFRIDHNPEFKLNGTENKFCNKADLSNTVNFPGDFSSDAQFFVFIGVITWLYCFASLALYVFYSALYTDEQKNFPQYDLVLAALLAFFWLAASSAWGHGLSGIKSVANLDWVTDGSDCGGVKCVAACEEKQGFTNISCELGEHGSFGTGNVSVLFGFLNCFLWAANCWFLYKETSWFRARQQPMAGQEATNPVRGQY